jgi:hypothetical protein
MMKSKISILMLVLALTLACDIGATAPTLAPLPSQPTLDQTPTEIISPTATSVPVTATSKATGIFTLAVLVDLTSEPVTREQAQTHVEEASEILFGLTGFKFEMIDFREISSSGTTDAILREYLTSAPVVLPNGIILFSFGDDDRAKLYGGYAYTLPGPTGYVNHFVSPYAHENDIYVGIIHFGHRFGRCGYGDSETPISNVSIDGECRNQPGTVCVEKYGYSMCSNLVDVLYASTPTYMTSTGFVHEIMHPFGPNGNQDHYWTAECTATMRSGISTRPYQADVFNSEESEFYTNMCPFVSIICQLLQTMSGWSVGRGWFILPGVPGTTLYLFVVSLQSSRKLIEQPFVFLPNWQRLIGSRSLVTC